MHSETMRAAIDIGGLLVAPLSLFLGLLILGSAVHKLSSLERARGVMQGFAGIPARFATIGVVAVALTELLAGLLLWSAAHRGAGALMAAIVWSAYLAVILRRIAQGRNDLDCGCSFGAAHASLGPFHVIRNVVLIGLVLGIGLTRPHPVGEGSWSFQVLPALALLVLYVALDQVTALKTLHRGAFR